MDQMTVDFIGTTILLILFLIVIICTMYMFMLKKIPQKVNHDDYVELE